MCLKPYNKLNINSPAVLSLQLQHHRAWDIIVTPRFSLILDLDEAHHLNWVRAVPFPAIQETRYALSF